MTDKIETHDPIAAIREMNRKTIDDVGGTDTLYGRGAVAVGQFIEWEAGELLRKTPHAEILMSVESVLGHCLYATIMNIMANREGNTLEARVELAGILLQGIGADAIAKLAMNASGNEKDVTEIHVAAVN